MTMKSKKLYLIISLLTCIAAFFLTVYFTLLDCFTPSQISRSAVPSDRYHFGILQARGLLDSSHSA